MCADHSFLSELIFSINSEVVNKRVCRSFWHNERAFRRILIAQVNAYVRRPNCRRAASNRDMRHAIIATDYRKCAHFRLLLRPLRFLLLVKTNLTPIIKKICLKSGHYIISMPKNNKDKN